MPSGVYKRIKPVTTETRKKISVANYGRKLTSEHKQKLKIAHIGKKASTDTKKKMSVARRGRKLTLEWKNKIGDANRGRKLPPVSSETREKLRVARRKRCGDKSPGWRGGVTKISESIRRSFKNRQWKSDVLIRDNYICSICFVRGGKLEVDHYPKMFAIILIENNIKTIEQANNCAELWNINNGRTLCIVCHKKCGKNNRELYQFIKKII